MFVRVKTTPNSPRRSVQLVEGIRSGGKVRQRIVRHLGIADNDDELLRLKELGEFLKQQFCEQGAPPAVPEALAEQILQAAARAAEAPKLPRQVSLQALREQHRLITGIHEVYGCLYRELGFDRLLSRRHHASAPVLFHIVMARIANPDSKRDAVRRLGRDFGVTLPLEKVYRMMDRLDGPRIERLRARVAEATEAVAGGPLTVLFFDCTTLYFESVVEDDLEAEDALRAFGYSKDGKPHRVQVLLALMVTQHGLPVGYEVFPGGEYEGNTFLPMLAALRRRHRRSTAVCVADAGMFSQDNLSELEAHGHQYIVGARLRSLPKALQARVLEVARYRRLAGMEGGFKVGVFRYRGRRVVVSYSPRRARKDAHDRERALARLLKKLKRSGQAKALVPPALARLVRMKGEGRWELDPQKLREAARWDGLRGVATNVRGLGFAEIFDRYRGLWQVEESFRITKHDLKARPVYHWTPRRVRAHLAIAYMAFACVRHLSYRVELQKKRRLSPEAIREALLHRQCSVLRHAGTGEAYVIPSPATAEAKLVYEAMGLPLAEVPYPLI